MTGVSATHIDWSMVPYMRKSFYKHFKDGIKYISDLSETEKENYINSINPEMSIEDEKYKQQEKTYTYALDMTIKESNQSSEALFHNLNSLQSRSGSQLPFSSINFGTCTLPEGRIVIKSLLETSISGLGKFHKTPIFPCSIMQLGKGINREPGDPNYDLFQLALKSTSQRLYPNYANVDWSNNAGYDKNDPKTFFSTINKTVA